MTLTQKLSLLIFALPVTLSAHAYEFPEVSDDMRDCYSKAMIGYDSVINARLGVPPEQALSYTARAPDATPEQAQYLDNILIVVWGGYLWKSSPHNYAISVFYHCAHDTPLPTDAAQQ
jgi:hypothetical protein